MLNRERIVRFLRKKAIIIAKILGKIIGREHLFILVKRFTAALLEGNGFSLSDLIPFAPDQIIFIKKYNFAILINKNDKGLAENLAQYQTHEPHVTLVLLGYLNPGICFLDIGANIGYYSFLVASQCPAAKIFSFEPDKTNFRIFKTGIFYNSYDNLIEAFPFAASDKDETIFLSNLGNNSCFGARFTGKTVEHLKSICHGPEPSFAEVKAVSLDNFLGNRKIELVKIDIEGYEPFAIKGMINIIKCNRPVIISEFAPSNLRSVGQSSPEEYLGIFTSLGYSLNVIKQDGSLIPFGDRMPDLMRHYLNARTHHLDLLLRVNLNNNNLNNVIKLGTS